MYKSNGTYNIYIIIYNIVCARANRCTDIHRSPSPWYSITLLLYLQCKYTYLPIFIASETHKLSRLTWKTACLTHPVPTHWTNSPRIEEPAQGLFTRGALTLPYENFLVGPFLFNLLTQCSENLKRERGGYIKLICLAKGPTTIQIVTTCKQHLRISDAQHM